MSQPCQFMSSPCSIRWCGDLSHLDLIYLIGLAIQSSRSVTVANSKHRRPVHMAVPEQPLQTSGSIGGHTPGPPGKHGKHDRCYPAESPYQRPTEHDQEKAMPACANSKFSCSKPRSVVHHSIQRKPAGKVDLSQTSLAVGVALEHESKLEARTAYRYTGLIKFSLQKGHRRSQEFCFHKVPMSRA